MDKFFTLHVAGLERKLPIKPAAPVTRTVLLESLISDIILASNLIGSTELSVTAGNLEKEDLFLR